MQTSSFFSIFRIFFTTAIGSNTTEVECETDINHYKFYQFSLIPAFLLTFLMAATKSRRQKLLQVLDGRPGLIFPMDTLTRSSRISYCCAFGATGFLVYQIILDGQYAIDYQGPLVLKTLIALLTMFIYGIVFFPVFTSLALSTAFSYLLGSLYVWMFFIVEVYKLTECKFTLEGRAILLTRALPSLLCLAYLSVSMPVKLCIAIYHKEYFTPSLGENPYKETIEQVAKSYQGKHVTQLLCKPKIKKPPQGIWNVIMAILKGKIHAWIYHSKSGFRYPSRLMSVMFVAACVVYVITVEFLVETITIFNIMLKVLDDQRIELESKSENADEDITVLSVLIAYYVTEILKVSFIVSVTVSSVITLLTIVHMMSSFRTNLFAMYRGDYSHIPSPELKSAVSLCTGSIKYAGFQVAYIVWAYIITCIVLLIICLILAGFIIVLMAGFTDWLVNKVLQIWPGFVIGICLFLVQFLLAKFVFLQDKGQHLRLNNRRFYFVFVYFMFFFNIVLGLVSCLIRILKAIAVGTIFMARLDNSTLPRKFEFLDPGFSAYQGYIHMEAAHTHPVVNVFIRLLVSLSNTRKQPQSQNKEIELAYLEVPVDDNGDKERDRDEAVTRPVNLAARFQWHVTYTLLHNPMVRIYRKGFIQSMKKARQEGLRMPISDMPITDFDLVKAQAEKDKETEEEGMKSQSHGMYEGLAVTTHFTSGGINFEKKQENKPNKCRWFRKWKKESGSETLTAHEIVSDECGEGKEKIDSYTKHQTV